MNVFGAAAKRNGPVLAGLMIPAMLTWKTKADV
jgi:hypothetical protein